MANEAIEVTKRGRLTRASIENHFSNILEEEISDEISMDDVGASIFLIVVNVSSGLYFLSHLRESTGFFTVKFQTFERVMLSAILIYWITTSLLILIRQKHPSRDLDSFGGLFIAAFANAWLLIVFPFDFTHFADASPDGIQFLLSWIPNWAARVLLFVILILHAIGTAYALPQRLYVRREMARRKQTEIIE